MEQIANQAAKLRYMLGGAVSVPLVMRFPAGSGTGAAAQHSQSMEAWFAHVPGLKVVQPATPHDAKGLLLAALEDPDPVMVFEHKLLYKMKGEVPEGHYTVPIGKAQVRREGTDVTIVATSIMVHRALEAAVLLSGTVANATPALRLCPFFGLDLPVAAMMHLGFSSALLREPPLHQDGDHWWNGAPVSRNTHTRCPPRPARPA